MAGPMYSIDEIAAYLHQLAQRGLLHTGALPHPGHTTARSMTRFRGLGQAPGYAIGQQDPGPQGPAVIAPNYLTNQPGAYQRDPSELREFFIGFDSISDVPAGGAVAISTTLQNPFRGKRLVVDPTIASSFLLQSIIVGVTPQAAAVTNTPCSTFVPESLVPLALDTGQVGQQITLNVINRSGAPVRFLAGMTGDVLR